MHWYYHNSHTSLFGSASFVHGWCNLKHSMAVPSPFEIIRVVRTNELLGWALLRNTVPRLLLFAIFHARMKWAALHNAKRSSIFNLQLSLGFAKTCSLVQGIDYISHSASREAKAGRVSCGPCRNVLPGFQPREPSACWPVYPLVYCCTVETYSSLP